MKNCILVAAVCLCIHIAAVQTNAQEPVEPPVVQGRRATGFPQAERDVDDLIRRLSAMDYATACREINNGGEDYNRAFRARQNFDNFADGQSYIRGVIADRRVARVYDYLSKMPAEEAAQKASELFDDKLNTHLQGWREVMAARGMGQQKYVPIEQNSHALRSAWFLVSCFGDGKTVLNKLDAWRAAMLPIQASMAVNPNLVSLIPYVQEEGVPDNHYVINIMLFTLRNENKLTPGIIREAERLGMPETEDLQFVAWNAHTGPFDLASQLGGARADERQVLFKIASAKHWNYRIQFGLEHSLLMEEGITSFLRQKIEPVREAIRADSRKDAEPRD